MFRARFLEESRIAASLNHPNVIPIYDMGSQDDLLYIAMRYVSGTDMRQMIKKRGRILPATALFLVGQAARRSTPRTARGWCTATSSRGTCRGRSGSRLPGGLRHHQARHVPQRADLDGTVPRHDRLRGAGADPGHSVLGLADQYSLGCVLYECLTGRVPFEKDLDAAIIWAHVEETPTMPTVLRPELPPEVDEVFGRVLAKRPDERYRSCREFVDAARIALGILGPGTEAALAYGATTAGPQTGPRPAARRGRRRTSSPGAAWPAGRIRPDPLQIPSRPPRGRPRRPVLSSQPSVDQAGGRRGSGPVRRDPHLPPA